MMRLTAHKASPTRGILRSLLAVLRLRQECLVIQTFSRRTRLTGNCVGQSACRFQIRNLALMQSDHFRWL